ncbi:hypothetical protein [Bdellovibrio sp. HCB209]|uniref:hypothetical protein n=1 Tax=Bdellovibrio sp. HCB209 TaxID=3394354 RepID=UPI0039B659FA
MSTKNKVIFVVDGKTERALEKKIDQSTCTIRFVRRKYNGREVPISLIAKECIGILNAIYSAGVVIVLIVDREDRDISDQTMEAQLRAQITAGFSGSYNIVVANQMFENWILSDIENVSDKNSEVLKRASNSASNEGKDGTTILNSLWKSNRGEKYSSDKITNAKVLFRSVRTDEGVKYSTSFDKLRSILTSVGVKFL